MSVNGSLDEIGRTDGSGDLACISFGSCPCDTDFDQLRGAFAISGDHLRQFYTDMGQTLFKQGKISLRCDRHAGGSIGQDNNHVIGACVSVHGQHVEALVHGSAQQGLQCVVVHGRIGGDEGQHRGHVGMDVPEPLAMPPIQTLPVLNSSFRAISFGLVSVVMMAKAAWDRRLGKAPWWPSRFRLRLSPCREAYR